MPPKSNNPKRSQKDIGQKQLSIDIAFLVYFTFIKYFLLFNIVFVLMFIAMMMMYGSIFGHSCGAWGMGIIYNEQ